MAGQNNGKVSKVEKIRLIILICEFITTWLIPIILALWDQMTLSIGIAILSANISVLFLISHFMEGQSSLVIQEIQENNFSEIVNKIEILEKNMTIDELFKKIYRLDNSEQKQIYLESIETFVETMNSRMLGARSGALSRHAYYGELTKASESIIHDKENIEGTYNGEIWAMTFWQDDELDLSDEYENAWVKRMEDMDNIGIKTTRLCVMGGKKKILARNVIDDEVENLLLRLSYYCKKNPVCKNTTVYAIDSIDTLSVKEQEWIGKGFFAIKLANGELRLIRGVSLDNRNATTLGGEIDFDLDRVALIRNIWQKLIEECGRQDINQYLWNNASICVRNKMKSMEFDVNND